MKKIKLYLIPLIAIGIFACNKNSLQLPDSKEEKNINKYIISNNVNIIEVTFKQEQYEIEGKTSVTFKNLTGITITDLKILVEKSLSEEGLNKYDGITNQSIISIDTLKTDKDFVTDLPFKTTTLTSDAFNLKLLSSASKKQNCSGSYNSVFIAFEKNNKQLIKYGFVNGYITADGDALFRIKADSSYYISANFMDTMSLNNGILHKSTSDLFRLIQLDTLETASKKFELTPTNLRFRLKLSATMPIDTTNSNTLLIKLQKN